MRRRRASRLLVLDPLDDVLLFRFQHNEGALAGQDFWATPGGALDPGETFERAALRELFEETGLRAELTGPHVASRRTEFALPTGEWVEAEERYFLVRSGHRVVSGAHWTATERSVVTAHRWWSAGEIAATTEQVFPENLLQMLVDAGVWKAA